jgi:hypothetical protein
VLTTIADGVDGGFFAPRPETQHCRWCDYKDVCDAQIDRIMKPKMGGPRAEAYVALEQVE